MSDTTTGFTLHLMADIETLGLQKRHPRPPITSIGLVAFTCNGILGRFYVGVDPGSCERYGSSVQWGTLEWWLDPKRDAARNEWLTLPKLEVDDALNAAIEWFGQWCGPDAEVPYKPGALFGKGATFDPAILRAWAEHLNIEWPWSFRQDECYRTLMNRSPIKAPKIAAAHTAIADAEGQALHLIEICKHHGLIL